MGRPTSREETRTRPIQIRVTPSEEAELQEMAFRASSAKRRVTVAGLVYDMMRRQLQRAKRG